MHLYFMTPPSEGRGYDPIIDDSGESHPRCPQGAEFLCAALASTLMLKDGADFSDSDSAESTESDRFAKVSLPLVSPRAPRPGGQLGGSNAQSVTPMGGFRLNGVRDARRTKGFQGMRFILKGHRQWLLGQRFLR